MPDKLNRLQNEEIEILRKKHQHGDIKVLIPISGHGHDDYQALKDFIVHKGVWNPMIVASGYHASYLYFNNTRLFYKKKVLDMGTGTGLMGIVMALHGAELVTMVDISKLAIKNAKANVKQFKLSRKCKVIESNLFKNVKNQFDFIVFNHPYFNKKAPDGDTISGSMMMSDDVIQNFLRDSRKHLKPRGKIMMPYFTPAGEANDPSIQAPKYGFTVSMPFATIVNNKLNGQIVIYELELD